MASLAALLTLKGIGNNLGGECGRWKLRTKGIDSDLRGSCYRAQSPEMLAKYRAFKRDSNGNIQQRDFLIGGQAGFGELVRENPTHLFRRSFGKQTPGRSNSEISVAREDSFRSCRGSH